MYAVAADREIWSLHPANNRYKESVFREFFDGALASGPAFAIVDQASNGIIGSSRYHGHDPSSREVEIGWTFLSRDYWGGSYNLEIKTLMFNHAFRFVDVVVFWVGETNHRSRRAIEKIGGKLRPGRHTRDGAVGRTDVIYEIRKPR